MRLSRSDFFLATRIRSTPIMSADHGVVVPLMRGCHCIWGLPRRAVHSLGIADGTVSATCANFGAKAQGKWHSSSRPVESTHLMACIFNDALRALENDVRCLQRRPMPSLGPPELLRTARLSSGAGVTSVSPRRASTSCSCASGCTA